MCNLYSITTNQAAIIALFRVVNRYVGNLAPMPGIFPDYKAPIVRNGADGRELAMARWGMPSSQKALMEATKKRAAKLEAKGKPVDFKELLRMEPDGGTTNIRNVTSKHWKRWLGVENRCVVPFNSLQRVQQGRGRRHLVRARREPPARLLRRHLDQLDVGPEGQGGRDHQRPLRVPDDRAERRGRRNSSEGDAGDPDDAGGSRDLDDGASGRGAEAAATAAGRRAPDRRPRRQGRSSHVAMTTTTSISQTKRRVARHPRPQQPVKHRHGPIMVAVSDGIVRVRRRVARLPGSFGFSASDRRRSRLPKRHPGGFFHIG